MSKIHNHGPLFDSSDMVSAMRSQFGLSPQRYFLWKKRGVPYAYRAEVARMAAIHGLPIPDGFFDPPAAKQAA